MALTKFSGEYNAWNYAYGVNPETPAFEVIAGSNAGGTYAVTLGLGVVYTPDGRPVSPVAGIPITIGSGTNVETVTPTSVVNPTPTLYGTCLITAAFTNAHGQGDLVRSGDFGLNEAATDAVNNGGGLIAVDAKLCQAAGITTNAGVITFVTTYKSLSASTTVLNKLGISGATSFSAAAASNYANNTTRVLY